MSFMFKQKGVLAIEAEGLDEEKVMEDALEAGAADFSTDGDVFEITTEPDDFTGVREDLEAKGYAFVSAEVEMIPDVYSAIDDPSWSPKWKSCWTCWRTTTTSRTSGTTGTTTEHRWIERGRGDPSSFRPLEYSTKLFFCAKKRRRGGPDRSPLPLP